MNPEVPVKGKNLEIEFKGYLSEQVPEGTQVEIVVKLGLVQLLKRKFDFCDKIQEIDEKCPIPEGEVTFHKEVELPNQIRKLYLYSNHTFSFTPFFSSLTLNATIAPVSKKDDL